MGTAYAVIVAGVLAGQPAQEERSIDELLQQIDERSIELRKKSERLKAKFAADAEARRREEEQGPYSVSSRNFIVGGPSKSLATAVLAKAEAYRKEIAETWLGRQLPEGAEKTLIRVTLSNESDEGLTLLCGPRRRFSGHHRMWLETSRQRATGTTLAHEVAHVVLNAWFPGGMPAWANEGIASSLDDPQRAADREQILAQLARAGDWPSVNNLLNARRLDPTNAQGYAVAVSLTEFLLSRGDRKSFLAFVADGRTGWDSALQESYGIDGVEELQKQWQRWVTGRLGDPLNK